MLGVPARMNEIIKIAKKKNIKVLEDNCEAVAQNTEENFWEQLETLVY